MTEIQKKWLMESCKLYKQSNKNKEYFYCFIIFQTLLVSVLNNFLFIAITLK